jgi:hypothetical protein
MLQSFISLTLLVPALLLMQSGTAASAHERPTIAIFTFTDPAGTGLAKELEEQMLIAQAKTQRFILVSRDFSKGPNDATSPVPISLSAAGYVLSGSLNFADKRPNPAAQAAASMIGMQLCVPDQYSVGVDVMLTDVLTGKVVYTDSVRTTVKPRCSDGGEGAGFSLALQTLSRKAANDMAISLYPIKVVTAQRDGTIVLDYGEAVLPVGTYLKVYGLSKSLVIDGTSIDASGPLLARMRVVEADAQTARAVKDGRGKLKLPPGAIARIDEHQGPADKSKGRKS